MHQVSYTSTRGEIWRWYWRAWARPLGLWRFHALIALFVAIARATDGPVGSFDVPRFVGAFAFSLAACVLVFPLWPQVRFKPQQRVLSIDSNGWTTQIGRVQGSRAWGAVRSVEDASDAIVFTSSNGNALIVPNRAFPDPSAREKFLSDARRWHAGITT